MFPSIQITATLPPVQAPTVTFSEGKSPRIIASTSSAASDIGLSGDQLQSIFDRLERLEGHVFKPSSACDAVAIEDAPTELEASTQAVMGHKSWAVVLNEIVRRLDSCAGQQTMSECIVSMRRLKDDLARLSGEFLDTMMTQVQELKCEEFLKGSCETEPAGPSNKFTRSNDWRSGTNPRFRHSTGTRQSMPNPKKWGPCFYCSLQEWKPGHSCEGSRAAELRRKQRESRDS